MKRSNYKPILLCVITILSLTCPAVVSPEASQKRLQKGDSEPIVIKSKSLEIDNKRKMVIFTGNVDARKDNFVINCHKMLVLYHDQAPDQGSGELDVKVDKIIATGKVKITRANGGLATAEKAIYHQDEEKVVLTGKPIVKQGNDFVEGSKITLFLREERSVVEGSENKKVRAVLSPRGGKR